MNRIPKRIWCSCQKNVFFSHLGHRPPVVCQFCWECASHTNDVICPNVTQVRAERPAELFFPFFSVDQATASTKPQRGGGHSGVQVTGMIEWSQKSRPKKIPRACSKTQKNRLRATDFVALKLPERGYTKTQWKTLEIEHSCLFIHHTIWIYPFPHLTVILTS